MVRSGHALTLLASLLAGAVAGGELRGSVSVESRGFAQPSADPAQLRASASLALEPEYRWRWDATGQQLVAAGFARVEAGDAARSHLDVRELYWLRAVGRWEWSLGLRHIHWGVTEVQHLVDVINQTDLVEDPDGEDKLGQPLASLALSGRRGRGELYLLPFFRERSFPGPEGRLRSRPLAGRAVYASPAGRRHVDWAARWSHNLGGCDLGLSYFQGTLREPSLVADATETNLRPAYGLGRQAGVDAQITTGPLLTKIEALSRWESSRRFSAATVGLEYTFASLGSGANIGALTEYVYDERSEAVRGPYQNDLFAGVRLVLNDVPGTELLAGVMTDLETGAAFINLEGSRRLGGSWRLATIIRGFQGIPEHDPLFPLRRDSYAQLELRRYF